MPLVKSVFCTALLLGASLSLQWPGPGLAQERHEEAETQLISLPAPTGPYPVGVTTWHWIDVSRPDKHSDRPGANREIMVHAWYPASATAADLSPAPYRPLARNDHDIVTKHSVAGPAFADMSSPAPIILLCPGRGVLAEYNTSLAEDLASHGFAVFAFDSPGIGHVIYPDGHEISPSPTYRPSSDLFLGPYEAVDKFFEPAVTLGAGDANFVFNQIVSLNLRDPANRFTGKINTKRIGIYGHSLGGRICGEVAARNRFVKAFAAMEAVPPRSIRREGEIKAPILMMYSSELPEELALPNIEGVIPNRKNDVFIARLEGLGHNSSTDLPLITDNSYQYQARPEEGVRVTRLLLAGFFNATLKNGDFPSADINAEECIRLRIYEGAARR